MGQGCHTLRSISDPVYPRDVLYTSEVTNMKMRLNDDLMEFIADASEARWTVTDALQNLYITIAD